ncbi:anhydro-N-acetylmuramic acid kinase [Legionella sp. W05-934-2]|jgi:anhydro-N-acetylmuramic acid kinase|uniref:anhydro-N-acetylmuramic acid kinase n=1 Tax=Legionella sp. W05-934-2 TaxID=1198649 RepID=UPI003462A016
MAYFAGLMSGTSMDGMDAVIIDEHNRLINGHTFNYKEKTYQLLSRVVQNRHADLADIGTLHRTIAIEFAESYNQLLSMSQIQASDVAAIGFHGQTISHRTLEKPFYTYQLGCASTLAAETSTTVVADFRSMDIALGGQGAPLAPLYHDYCFGRLQDRVAIVNIGGIANLSMFIDEQLVAGYDIGPGNCLMNSWIKAIQNVEFDKDGAWAACGHVNQGLLKKLLKDHYFHLSGPKSVDREYFSLAWLKNQLKPGIPSEDVQATLLELTAMTIANQVQLFSPVNQLILCGGGVHNTQLNQRISYLLPNTTVSPSSQFGINENYLEAMMMAWLAKERLNQRAFNLASITGNPYPTMLGHVFIHPDKSVQ